MPTTDTNDPIVAALIKVLGVSEVTGKQMDERGRRRECVRVWGKKG